MTNTPTRRLILATILGVCLLAPMRTATAETLRDDASVDELLDALDQAGRDLSNLSAAVKRTEMDLETGDTTVRLGKIALQRAAEGTTFRVTFVGVQTNADAPNADENPQIRPEKIEYLLRGNELIDRNYEQKVQVTRTLPAEQAGKDLLKLGEGPFPLPIGQKKEDVRDRFDVTAVDPADAAQNELGEPAANGTRRIRLTPKADSPLAKDFAWVEIDVALDAGLPSKVITLNAAGTEAQVTTLKNLKVNADLPADAFRLEAIDLRDWNTRVEGLRQPPQ